MLLLIPKITIIKTKAVLIIPIKTTKSRKLEWGKRKLDVFLIFISPYSWPKLLSPVPNKNSWTEGLYLAINIPQSSDLFIRKPNKLNA